MAGSSQGDDGVIDGINVTPLVDITLVLLVVLMVTAKILVTPAIPLDLPTSTAPSAVQTVFVVTLPPDGIAVVDGRPIDDGALVDRARSALAEDRELRAVVQADGSVPHRRVIAILDSLAEARISRVAFATVARDVNDAR